jgi:hypothetical protein
MTTQPSDSPETVTLKNGSVQFKPLVIGTMITLSHLLEDEPIAFLELVEVCKDREHQVFGNADQVLKRLAMMEQDGSVHSAIRDIVLCAVEGKDLDIHLVSPIEASG